MRSEVSELKCILSRYESVSAAQPASKADLFQLQQYALREYGRALPSDYISFLQQSNGLQVENALFMAAADVALMNEDSPMAGYVRIGGAGNVDDYTFEVVTGRFIVAPLGRPNAAWSSHSSFWQLLESIIKEQGGSNA